MQPNSDEGGRVKFCDINSFKIARWWAVSESEMLQGRHSFGQEKISDII